MLGDLYVDAIEGLFRAIPRWGWLVAIVIGVYLFFKAAPEYQDDGIGFVILGSIWLLILGGLRFKALW